MTTPVTIWSLEDAKKYHVHSRGLSEWLCNNLDPRYPVFDFGCGKGTYVAALIRSGFSALGFEGTPGISEIADVDLVLTQDITRPMSPPKRKGSVICIEVMEHVLPEQQRSVLNNLVAYCNDTMVLSWAIPGQAGHGHNNCRDEEYVIGQMADRGFYRHAGLTKQARIHAHNGDPYLQFFNNSLHVFKKEK
jgi:hypothetical protein